MTIQELKQKKQELGYTNKQLAEISGIPLGTVQKVFSGNTKAPRRDTILALTKVLTKSTDTYPSFVREESAYSTKKKEYTIADYMALPEDVRVELIDGVFYDMAPPYTGHQAIAGYIHKKLLDFTLERKGPCLPLISPVGVQLDSDDKTIVEPDVLIVCDRDKVKKNLVKGAPDFIIEVLSPSTRKKDMQLKLYKYGNAGVREYWMVDMQAEKVIVYDLEHEDIPKIYTFNDTVPVMIWNNECTIDFSEIHTLYSFLYAD